MPRQRLRSIRKPSSTFPLPNTTSTDLFCNAQLVLPVPGVSPQERQVLLAGGDTWPRTDHTANPDSVIFDPGTYSLTKSVTTMNHPRWYASPTTLANGETYLQGGMGGGEAHPEIRDSSGTFRELSDVNTQDILWYYPRNRVAPDGRIFGYSDRQMYYVNPNGQGHLTLAGTMPADGPSGNTSTDVMYAPARSCASAAVQSGPESQAIADPGQERSSGDRLQRNVADLQTSLLDAGCAALGQRHGHRRWPGRRHRR